MFDATGTIEEGYLWNFSPRDRRKFLRQHKKRQAAYYRYNAKLAAMVATDEQAIFANYDPHSSTPFEIKYTFNRIYMNDPRERELLLDSHDPFALTTDYYTRKIPWAFEYNTYCRTVVLNGVRSMDGWRSRGFNDKEASKILDAFSDKRLKEFTFSSYPLLTDITYLKIANMAMHPKNRWEHVTLGQIPVAPDIASILDRTKKVSYTRIARQQAGKSFFSRLFRRGADNERS